MPSSHDPRVGHFAVGSPSIGAGPSVPAPPARRPRTATRFLARTLAVLVAVGAVVAGVVALASAVPEPGSAVPISQRDWLLIAKDPDAHHGERIVVFGEVTQMDSATGNDAMRADITGEAVVEDPGTNTILNGDRAQLRPFVEGDRFRAEVEVDGSTSYDTQFGGNTTTPELTVTSISPLPAG